MRFMKSQEGLIIAGFALATVMIIALLVTYLSNRVVDMIAIQKQVFFSKQAYWNAYSGMELSTSKKIAGLDGIPSPADASFATGKITITHGTPDLNEYLGGNKVSAITSTGSDAGGRSRAMKLTIGNPSPSSYALFLDNSHPSPNSYWVDIESIQDDMTMTEVGENPNESLRYASDTDIAADWTVSFWIRPDFETMIASDGNGSIDTNCSDEQTFSCKYGTIFGVNDSNGDNKPSGVQIMLHILDDGDQGYLDVRYSSVVNVTDAGFTGGTPTQMTSNNWYHVVYYRSAGALVANGVGYLYVNGIKQGQHADQSYFLNTDLWYIGTDLDSGPPITKTNSFAGCLDEVAVWKIALSEAQIQTLYIQGKSFNIATNMGTNLVAYWDFDNTSNDQSGNSNTANITGAGYTGF